LDNFCQGYSAKAEASGTVTSGQRCWRSYVARGMTPLGLWRESRFPADLISIAPVDLADY
jgi:hypothetical protein